MAASTAPSRTNSRVNYSNEIHDLSTVQSGGSAVPTMYYPEKSLADIFPPHLGKKVRVTNCCSGLRRWHRSAEEIDRARRPDRPWRHIRADRSDH